MTRLLIVGVITSAGLFVAILALIRTRRLQERYAILWLLAALGVVIFGLWKRALVALADLFGIAYPPSALFLVAALFAVAVLLHTAVVLTRLSSQNQTLAQRLAIMEERLRRLEGRAAAEDAPGEPAPPPMLRGAPRAAPGNGRRRAPVRR